MGKLGTIASLMTSVLSSMNVQRAPCMVPLSCSVMTPPEHRMDFCPLLPLACMLDPSVYCTTPFASQDTSFTASSLPPRFLLPPPPPPPRPATTRNTFEIFWEGSPIMWLSNALRMGKLVQAVTGIHKVPHSFPIHPCTPQPHTQPFKTQCASTVFFHTTAVFFHTATVFFM